METFEGRLESFSVVHPTTKKRTSNSKGNSKLKWPHKSPDPIQLAKAGFFYKPSASRPDSTTCYLCHYQLDGWEEDDNPIEKHLSFAPHCGWATIVQIEHEIEHEIEHGYHEQADPMDERQLDARRKTFAANWPHENKRGWLCKIEKMIEGGWYYCPTPDSEDFVRCCYCGLSLDGWEPKDNPYDEHQRRSPDCAFFASISSKSKQTTRGKKGRASKASRVSTQSDLATASEDFSTVDVTSLADASLMQNTESASAQKLAQTTKKSTKGRKALAKSKRKAPAAVQEDAVAGSSFVEPEDDNFEIKVDINLIPSGRGKKRKSDEMSVDNELSLSELKLELPQPQQPPSKRRAIRSSISYVNEDPYSTLESTLDDATHLKTDQDTTPPPQPNSKNTAKRGRKRASTSTRNTSAISTASKASLRATVANDEELEAALEADLERPLTDDEGEVEPPPLPRTKTRRLTKTRPGSRKVTASTAPVRRATRASALPVEGDSETKTDAPRDDQDNRFLEQKSAMEIALNAIDHAKQEIIAETGKRTASKAKTRGRAPSKAVQAAEANLQAVHEQPAALGQLSRNFESTENTDLVPVKDPRTSEVSIASIQSNGAFDSNNSVIVPTAGLEQPRTEDDARSKGQNGLKKGGKRGAATAAKKGKAKTKGAAKQDKATEMVHVEVEDICGNNPEPVVEVETPDDQISVGKAPSPEAPTVEVVPKTEGKGPKPKKGKTAKARASTNMPTSDIASTEPAESFEDTLVTFGKERDAAEETQLTSHREPNENIATPAEVATPGKEISQEEGPSVHKTPQTAVSPQSSNAENQPPSSRPSALRPPLSMQSSSKGQGTRVVLAAATPTTSPSKRNTSCLQSTLPWTSIDFEKLCIASPAAEKENLTLVGSSGSKEDMTSSEKKLTVEEWIWWNAQRGEDKLRDDCERLVSRFEGEGVRALKTLEGILCAD